MKIAVIGAGPAGIMASLQAAQAGANVSLFESKPRIALKLGISGKGRGNITNSCSFKDFLNHFNDKRFLKYAFKSFSNTSLIAFFENMGVKLEEERGGRVFVASGRAIDAVNALYRKLNSENIELFLATPVDSLIIEKGVCKGLISKGKKILADKLVLATGGMSYPQTGSTGDGLKFATLAGHTLQKPYPSLVALKPAELLSEELENLNLINISASLWLNGRKDSEEQGEMLFRDGMLDGPVILKLSRKAVKPLFEGIKTEIVIDFKPALSHEKLDNRILRDIEKKKTSNLYDLARGLVPAALVNFLLQKAGLSPKLNLSDLKADNRKKLRNILKEMRFEITDCGGWDRVIVTSGGISLREVPPETMESKLIENLYFAGEILDIDADTGGYNLQAAFSTGYVAGKSASALL